MQINSHNFLSKHRQLYICTYALVAQFLQEAHKRLVDRLLYPTLNAQQLLIKQYSLKNQQEMSHIYNNTLGKRQLPKSLRFTYVHKRLIIDWTIRTYSKIGILILCIIVESTIYCLATGYANEQLIVMTKLNSLFEGDLLEYIWLSPLSCKSGGLEPPLL